MAFTDLVRVYLRPPAAGQGLGAIACTCVRQRAPLGLQARSDQRLAGILAGAVATYTPGGAR